MLHAAARRLQGEQPVGRLDLVRASMDALPVRSRSCDLVIAHGIWNLAPSSTVFRRAGRPQCFLTEAQFVSELALAGFVPDPSVPVSEYNRPRPGLLPTGAPAMYEAAFRRA
jgi:hypothetical protein